MSSNLWQVWADKVELMSSSFWRDLFTLCFVMDIKRSDPALIVSIITYLLMLPGHLDNKNSEKKITANVNINFEGIW